MDLMPYKKRQDRWMDPFRELEHIQQQMNQLFDFSLSRPFGDATLLGGQWAPAVDVYDSADNILIKADLPGLNKDDIDVTVESDQLILKGEKKKENEIEEDNYYKTERFTGSFFRTIPLPAEVEAEKVDAKFSDGVLTLNLPKREEAKPKRIKIDVK